MKDDFKIKLIITKLKSKLQGIESYTYIGTTNGYNYAPLVCKVEVNKGNYIYSVVNTGELEVEEIINKMSMIIKSQRLHYSSYANNNPKELQKPYRSYLSTQIRGFLTMYYSGNIFFNREEKEILIDELINKSPNINDAMSNLDKMIKNKLNIVSIEDL